MVLPVKTVAPEFTLTSDAGKKVSLSQFHGQPVVLYFYPKDNTPGCTKEACAFRDHFNLFTEKGVIILGVSKDTPASHANFKKKYDLPFTLLSDEQGVVCRAYDVVKSDSLLGKLLSKLAVQRSTFLIDKAGIIQAAWPKVVVPGHVEAVIATL